MDGSVNHRRSSKAPVFWIIFVYDRRAEVRLPFKQKYYELDHNKASSQEVIDIIGIINEIQDPSSSLALKTNKEAIVETISIRDKSQAEKRLLKYRHFFEPVPDEQSSNFLRALPGAQCVSLLVDRYLEDENEKPITQLQAFDEEAQRRYGKDFSYPPFEGNLESILRVDLVDPIKNEEWSETSSQVIELFFSIFNQLRQSEWMQKPCGVSSSGSEVWGLHPSEESYRSVILLFRQLFSGGDEDNIFNRACKIFKRHSPKDHPVYSWVDSYRKKFNSLLNNPVLPRLENCDLSAGRYLSAIAYGAHIVHGPKNGTESTDSELDYKKLLECHPRQMIVFRFHLILCSIVNLVSMVVPVMSKNYEYWTKELGWSGSSKPSAQDLFAS